MNRALTRRITKPSEAQYLDDDSRPLPLGDESLAGFACQLLEIREREPDDRDSKRDASQ